jgi:hypothetical protein
MLAQREEKYVFDPVRHFIVLRREASASLVNVAAGYFDGVPVPGLVAAVRRLLEFCRPIGGHPTSRGYVQTLVYENTAAKPGPHNLPSLEFAVCWAMNSDGAPRLTDKGDKRLLFVEEVRRYDPSLRTIEVVSDGQRPAAWDAPMGRPSEPPLDGFETAYEALLALPPGKRVSLVNRFCVYCGETYVQCLLKPCAASKA